MKDRNYKLYQTINQMIVLQLLSVNETIYSSDIMKATEWPHLTLAGVLSSLRRNGYLQPLFRDGRDLCWERIK